MSAAIWRELLPELQPCALDNLSRHDIQLGFARQMLDALASLSPDKIGNIFEFHLGFRCPHQFIGEIRIRHSTHSDDVKP